MRSVRVTLAALAAALLSHGATAQVNANKSCDCANLESIQQEVENAEYLEKFMRDLSDRLDKIEQEQVRVNQIPTHPDSGRSVLSVSANARDQFMKPPSQGGLFDLPHPQVKGYTGPQTVNVMPNTCQNEPGVLEALELGTPCRDIAEIVLRHEAVHRAECEAVGKDAYWDRLPSSMAAEEAERYAQQSREMRDLLKRVVGEGDWSIETSLDMKGSTSGFSGAWLITSDKASLEGGSASADGKLTLTGKTRGVSRMTQATVAGKGCTISGEFIDEVEFRMETDGFSVSMTEKTKSVSGQMKVSCGKGIGMSLRPSGEVGSGPIMEGEPLQTSQTVTQDASTMAFAQGMAGAGMTVTGSHNATLVCTPK